MSIKKKARIFLGAFMATAVCIGCICGLMAVDLITDSYMPGEAPPIFLISRVSEEGVDVAWMGEQYHMDAQAVRGIQEKIWGYRGLLPRSVRITGGIAAWGIGLMRDMLGAQS